MTLDLDPIRQRHEAATSGTWYLQPNYGPDFVAAEIAGYEHGIGTLNFGDGDQADADREFVLNAHADMGQLIAEVERLRARVGELLQDSATLAALYAGGVDNWGGYSDALSSLDDA